MEGQEKKRVTEDEMVGWHHWLNGHEFEQTLRDGEGREVWCAAVHGVLSQRVRHDKCYYNNKCYYIISNNSVLAIGKLSNIVNT